MTLPPPHRAASFPAAQCEGSATPKAAAALKCEHEDAGAQGWMSSSSTFSYFCVNLFQPSCTCQRKVF